MSYHHRQRGTLVLVTMGIFGVLILVIFATALSLSLAAIPLTVAALLVINFGWLDVRLDAKKLHLAFGVGWIRRSISLDRIAAAEVVKTRWFYGWGIRLTPKGWMWNTSGFDAVQLTYHDGKHFLIGSDDANRLAAAIEQAVNR